jgi:hypothetical protein
MRNLLQPKGEKDAKACPFTCFLTEGDRRGVPFGTLHHGRPQLQRSWRYGTEAHCAFKKKRNHCKGHGRTVTLFVAEKSPAKAPLQAGIPPACLTEGLPLPERRGLMKDMAVTEVAFVLTVGVFLGPFSLFATRRKGGLP